MAKIPYDMFLELLDAWRNYPGLQAEPYENLQALRMEKPYRDAFLKELGKFLKQQSFGLSIKDETIASIQKTLDDSLCVDDAYVHYTSREVLCKILTDQEFWLTCVTGKTQEVNDLGEAHFGIDAMEELLRDACFRERMKRCYELVGEPQEPFDTFVERALSYVHGADTYLACFIKEPAQENGRLSMWTRYARRGGVAIYFKKNILSEILRTYLKALPGLRSCFLPTIYAPPASHMMKDFLAHWLDRIEENKMELRGMYGGGEQSLWLKEWNDVLSICISIWKNAWFREESEYRMVIRAPKEAKEIDDIVSFDREYIQNHERHVCKLHFNRLFDAARKNGTKISWEDLIDRIVVWKTDEKEDLGNSRLKEVLTKRGLPESVLRPVQIPFW